jgi:diphthamide synthase (EF-2-diphthine--ammonia ligase)
VLDGKLFSEEEKRQIKELVNRYSKRLPKEYLWGRDNCQLLITFTETQVIPFCWVSLFKH